MDSHNKTEHTAKTKTKKWPKAIIAILALLLLISAAGMGYFYAQYQDVKNDPQKVTQAEITEITEKAGRLISLPKDEQPTLATVNDTEKLQGQPFFSEAQDGDKLLIYPEAKKAFIYRPSENIIVNVGPIVLNADDQSDETD